MTNKQYVHDMRLLIKAARKLKAQIARKGASLAIVLAAMDRWRKEKANAPR